MQFHRAIAALTAVALSAAPMTISGTVLAAGVMSLPPVAGSAAAAVSGTVASAAIPSWLARANLYRKLAGLPDLVENTTWSNGDRLHAKYEVKNDTIGHSEDAGNPWYTTAGNAAAGSSNVMVSYSTTTTNSQAIDTWMQGPFHAVGVVDPALQTTGYGSYREVIQNQNIEMSGALDVIRGLGQIPSNVHLPVKYPSGNTALPIRTAPAGEFPDPLAKCPGYTFPSGPPIILQLGQFGSVVPHVTAHSLKLNGVNQTSCEFDETSYPHSSLEYLILNERDAIVLMPKKPLKPGKTYQVSIATNGHTYNWSFKVAANAQ